MHEQALERVAYPRAVQLGVFHDGGRHVEVGAFVDVDVDHALVVLHDRHTRVLGDEADEAFATARDEEVDVAGEAEHDLGRLATEGRDDLHGALREPRLS